MSSNTHIFALYSANTVLLHPGALVTLHDDPSLIFRLSKVLRVRSGQHCIIFNSSIHNHVEINSIDTKSGIKVKVIKSDINQPLRPLIDWWVPILEKEDWGETLEFLTILGATTIQPLVTHKVHRKHISDRDHERMQRLMIAAAEQSKQFVLPILHKIATLEEMLDRQKPTDSLLFFDFNGQPAYNVVQSLYQKESPKITCLVGPEGDLTEEEKKKVQEYGFSFCALTPSVLRSAHAVAIATGLIRCLISKRIDLHQ